MVRLPGFGVRAAASAAGQAFADELLRRRLLGLIEKNCFWFVDIPRTSSSSLRSELALHYGPVYGKTNLLDPALAVGGDSALVRFAQAWIGDHATAQQLRKKFGRDLWAKLFTFSLVRNPWDRMVSLYCYRKKRGQLLEGLSFRDYILQLESPSYGAKRAMHSRQAYYYGASEFICDGLGRPMVNYVGRFEDRAALLEQLSLRLGYRQAGGLLTQQAKPADTHYSQFYDRQTEAIVGRVYQRDIEIFDYRFERGAVN